MPTPSPEPPAPLTQAPAADLFDPEPVRSLPADELPTAGWVPAVGAVALFGVLGIAVALGRPATPPATPVASPSSAAASHQGSGEAQPAPRPVPVRPGASAPTGAPRLSPAQMEEMRRRLQGAREVPGQQR